MKSLTQKLHEPVSIAPLAMLRMLFGGVMLASILRFWAKGWIADLYLKPDFHFHYTGFSWVDVPGETGTYVLFIIAGLAALGIALGLFYRLAAPLFFLSFTYIELLDKAYYLNHYYFISLVALLLCFVPAHRAYSLDVLRIPRIRSSSVPRWTILTFQLQLAIVYFYAGAAKLNHDWLFRAEPLKTWLPAHSHWPLIGSYLSMTWVAYLFSWFGALFDLSIPFALSHKRTRIFAYLLVIAFHGLTGLLFPIGMFPWIMIGLTLVFFPPSFHRRILEKVPTMLRKPGGGEATSHPPIRPKARRPYPRTAITACFLAFFLIQLLLPWRYLLYPGDLFWTESGYRFSWRVMLMEKAGTAFFHVKDQETGGTEEVDPDQHLTPFQEKMMSTKPDMILEFARYLEKQYRQKGIADPIVRVRSYVTLNGSGTKLFADPTKDLTAIGQSTPRTEWIIPFSADERRKELSQYTLR